jgi:hypothetical protein
VRPGVWASAGKISPRSALGDRLDRVADGRHNGGLTQRQFPPKFASQGFAGSSSFVSIPADGPDMSGRRIAFPEHRALKIKGVEPKHDAL